MKNLLGEPIEGLAAGGRDHPARVDVSSGIQQQADPRRTSAVPPMQQSHHVLYAALNPVDVLFPTVVETPGLRSAGRGLERCAHSWRRRLGARDGPAYGILSGDKAVLSVGRGAVGHLGRPV